jgi:hypothetical protein
MSVKKKHSVEYDSLVWGNNADHESDPLFETPSNVYDLLTHDVDTISDRMTTAEKNFRKMSKGPRRFSTLAREQVRKNETGRNGSLSPVLVFAPY